MKTKEIKSELDKAYALINEFEQAKDRKKALEKELKIEMAKDEIRKNKPPLADENYYNTEILKCTIRFFEIEKEYYSIIQTLA